MARVSTYLNFPRTTEAAFAFYKSVFGTEYGMPVMRFKDAPPNPQCPLDPADADLVIHVELPILGGHVLMGTDAPALDAQALRQAAAALHQHDAVFAPTADGGYALVGLRYPMAMLFDGMTWSTPRVMDDTRARLRAHGLRHAELPPVHDIDEAADLAHLPAGWLA